MIESDRPKRATRANRSQAWDEVQRLACERVASAPPDAACHRRAIEQSYGTGAVRIVQLHRGGAGRAWAMVPVGLAIVCVLLALLLSGCAPVGVAADAARQQALLCAGNATGPNRCQDVRNVEADNAQCWDAQVYTLTGEHALPPEVLAEVASVVSR